MRSGMTLQVVVELVVVLIVVVRHGVPDSRMSLALNWLKIKYRYVEDFSYILRFHCQSRSFGFRFRARCMAWLASWFGEWFSVEWTGLRG